MYTSLGAMLTALRKARKLSQSQAAQAAQIGRVTLTRWETNVQTPRLADLNLLLAALNATPAQKRQALQLLESPEARKHTQALVAQMGERRGLTAMPHGGMLLQAMRSRCGLSLEEAAERIGVTSRTLRRWEKGEVWPEIKALHTLCHALGAHEEEVVALTCGTLQFAGNKAHSESLLSADALEDRLQRTLRRIAYGEQHLIELEVLSSKRQAWGLAARQPLAKHLLSYAWHLHSYFYLIHGRTEEAGQLAQEGMELLPEKKSLPHYAAHFAVDIACGTAFRHNRPNPKRGVELLRPWLAFNQYPAEVAYLRSIMANLLAHAGAIDAAVTTSREGWTMTADLPRQEQDRRAFTHAEILMNFAKQPREALKVAQLPPSNDAPIFRAEVRLLHAEIFTALNESSNADHYLQEAVNLIEMYQLSVLHPRLNALQNRL